MAAERLFAAARAAHTASTPESWAQGRRVSARREVIARHALRRVVGALTTPAGGVCEADALKP